MLDWHLNKWGQSAVISVEHSLTGGARQMTLLSADIIEEKRELYSSSWSWVRSCCPTCTPFLELETEARPSSKRCQTYSHVVGLLMSHADHERQETDIQSKYAGVVVLHPCHRQQRGSVEVLLEGLSGPFDCKSIYTVVFLSCGLKIMAEEEHGLFFCLVFVR